MDSETEMGGVRVGFVTARPSPAELRDTVPALEALGASSLWAPGHIATDRAVPEAMTGLAALASLSERAVVGTSVLLAPLYHPVVIAKQAAELDRLTGGRVVVGVGVGGEYEEEFRACQVDPAERGARADEAIDVMKALWRGEKVSHAGHFWPFDSVRIMPGPVQRGGPPVVVAGRKVPAMRRAVERGDGWMPFLYSPERYADSVARIKAMAEAVGRDLGGFWWTCFIYVRVDDDAGTARREAAAFIGAGQAGDGSRFRDLVDRVAVAGTPDDVRRGLQAFVAAGARHLVLMPCERYDYLGAARRIMKECVPGLDG